MPVIERMISNRLIVEEARRLGDPGQSRRISRRTLARLEEDLLLRLYAESLVARAVTAREP